MRATGRWLLDLRVLNFKPRNPYELEALLGPRSFRAFLSHDFFGGHTDKHPVVELLALRNVRVEGLEREVSRFRVPSVPKNSVRSWEPLNIGIGA